MPAACEACSGAHQAEPQKEEVAYALDKPQPYEIAVAAHSHGLKSELTAGEFSVALDAGFALGGKQTAPSPVQAFISSIVACTQITLQIVAKDEGVELGDIQWSGWGFFDTRKLVADVDANPRFQQIKVQGKVATTANQATLDDLAAKTSQRCPISQSLHPEIDFKLALEAVPQ